MQSCAGWIQVGEIEQVCGSSLCKVSLSKATAWGHCWIALYQAMCEVRLHALISLQGTTNFLNLSILLEAAVNILMAF